MRPPSTRITGSGVNSGHIKEHHHIDNKDSVSGDTDTSNKIPRENNSAPDQKIQNRQAAPVSRKTEKMAILEECKIIYQKALKAQNHYEFANAASSIQETIQNAYQKFELDIENGDINRYINERDIKKLSNSKCYLANLPSKCYLANLPDEPKTTRAIEEDLDEFVQGDQALALKTHHSGGHACLSIMERLEGGEIRVTAIDSVGLCSSHLPFTTPIDIFLKSVVKGLNRYSGTPTCCPLNTKVRT